MKFWDLIKMSCSNLWRRKLRTFLTILGVVIGTASIVVMVSLGLGLNKTTMDEMENSGGLTTIQVYEGGSAMMGFAMAQEESADQGSQEQKRITDEAIEQIGAIPHVTLVSPVLNLSMMAKQGRYIGYLDVYGMSREALEQMKLEFASGGLPEEGTENLQFVYGNQVIYNFSNESTGQGYWETGELPDVDFTRPLYYILDTDAYWSSKMGSADEGVSEGGDGDSGTQQVTAPKKYVFPTAGVLAGDLNTYTEQSYSVYCDINALKTQLKKTFRNKAIPGQPTTKSGKPYKEIFYSQAYVKIDDMENAEAVQNEIKNLGYTPNWNAEWVKSQQKQFQSIQLVLGCIGAVSLFVAAIGIANTMMMSIYERTKEIGIIKVLGCSLANIRTLFLAEAAFIGFLGGMAGLALSYLISWALNHFGAAIGEYMTGNSNASVSYIPVWLAGLALIFAICVGIVAGFFPALRATRLSPLAAIRNE
ncbi:ABC transporter permease [Ruminococcus gauvreauii]|uniref:ABC transporter permease n=1 Tax=Ruminococcus gauvreauii TaxID=438033 RepID=A0ABY5VJD7_9FIRM|nr:ABC transporter permease [Ruminococcus gauvreauii]UWP60326.1 ABC transporter permease [Ruminococcus gauvreauii]